MGLIKYTKELETDISQQYLAGKTVEEIAQPLGVTTRSVISKLSALGIYQKKSYTNKLGETPVRKSEYVSQICEKLNIDEDFGESLSKVNKSILKLILQRL